MRNMWKARRCPVRIVPVREMAACRMRRRCRAVGEIEGEEQR
jgi:hypothetical protein